MTDQTSATATDPLIREEDIRRLVHRFYGKVRANPDLAPIFATKIDDADWPEHLETMCDFWSSLMLATGRFKGRPMPKHRAIADIARPEHFEIWLGLFREAATETQRPDIAAAFVDRAVRIAVTLQAGMYRAA